MPNREDLNLGCGPMHNCFDFMQVTSPSVCDFPTPSISECSNVSGFSNTLDTIFTQDDGISDFDRAFILEQYMSDKFLHKDDTRTKDVQQILKDIRLRNINKIIIGHSNVNFFAHKIDG